MGTQPEGDVTTAYERLIVQLRACGSREGPEGMWQCPAHDDHTPSLSVTPLADRVLLYCHADCETKDVLTRLGLTFADLFNAPGAQAGSPAARYEYHDAEGRLIATKVRTGRKDFRWERGPTGDKSPWALYRLPEVLMAKKAGLPVWLCEGEKDADRVRELGQIGTTPPHGAGTWNEEWTEMLRGLDVCIVADRDLPGFRHADNVADQLREYASSVRVFLPRPDFPGADLSDHLDAGYDLFDDLIEVHDKLTERIELMETPKLKLIDFKWYEENGIPPQEWLVKGWLAKSELVGVIGPPKTGKTVTVAHMVQHIVMGRDWCGFEVPEPRKVLWLDEEQHEHTAVRQVMRLAKGLDAEPWRSGLQVASGSGVRLDTDEGADWLAAVLAEHQPDVLVIDSLAKATAGIEENSNNQMALVSRRLVKLRDEFGCAIVLLHHVTKAAFKAIAKGNAMESARGAGEFSGNVDVLLAVKRKSPNPLHFWVEIRRESDEPVLEEVHLERVCDPDDPLSPVYLNSVDPPEPLDDVTARLLEQAKQAQLDALRRSDEPIGTAELNSLAGTKEKTAQRARKALEREGLIESPRKGLWRITEQDTLTDEGEAV